MRKICVVTSTRAEYGIMSRLIEKINQDDDLELQLAFIEEGIVIPGKTISS